MNTPWAIILCKFSDGNSEPFPIQYYKDLFTSADVGSKWNMVKLYHDCAHGNVDVSGSKVFGWFQLTQSVADYNALGQGARAALIGWARAAAQANGVDLTPFWSTVACTNLWSDVGEAGGGVGVVAQGTTPTPGVLGQEMGHVYGVNHSRKDGTTADYTDPWDMMSGYSDYPTTDPEFTSIGPAYNAWNLRYRKWLDETRVWSSVGGAYDQTVKLRPLPRHDLSGWLAAEVPGGFLAEYREQAGWDAGIPRPAVLVHRFDSGHSYLMNGNGGVPDLVAGDSFGDPAPTGPGSLFKSYQRIDVLSIDPTAHEATLRLRYQPALALPHVNGQAVDPMYLILSAAAYLVWVEQHYPHVPDIENVAALLRTMEPEAQRAALARARVLGEVARVVLEASAKISG
jgi:hypothetical protein